jgi:hypothetical protein
MARRSQWAAVERRSKQLERFFEKHGRAARGPGQGGSYVYNRELPVSPPTAYFLRRYSSFWDALHAWRADRPKRDAPADAWQTVPLRIEAANAVMEGLRQPSKKAVRAYAALKRRPEFANFPPPSASRNNYRAADAALGRWCADASRATNLPPKGPFSPNHPDLRMRVAWELLFWLRPLLIAYADPRRFFAKVAPQIDPNRLFDLKQLRPVDHPFISHGRLAEALHTWGFGALLNPNVTSRDLP